MTMRTIVVCAVALTSAAWAQVQEPGPGRQRSEMVVRHMGGGPGPGAGMFVAAENSAFAPVVKGAPFSAETYTEFRQVLGDGNVIERKTRGASYRDSEGRTRTENTIGGGVMAPGGESRELIMIKDSVANIQWVLNPETKEATKIQIETSGGPVHARTPNPDVLVPAPAAPMPHVVGVGPQVQMFRFRAEQAKEEKLGTQNINGVQAEGTRTTVTIPAGEIGNVQPIVMTTERWYSPQLQMVVRTRHSDPRTGDHTFELTNIRLGEPPSTLFQVPSGYEIQEGKMRMEVKHSSSGEGGKNVEVRREMQIRHAAPKPE